MDQALKKVLIEHMLNNCDVKIREAQSDESGQHILEFHWSVPEDVPAAVVKEVASSMPTEAIYEREVIVNGERIHTFRKRLDLPQCIIDMIPVSSERPKKRVHLKSKELFSQLDPVKYLEDNPKLAVSWQGISNSAVVLEHPQFIKRFQKLINMNCLRQQAVTRCKWSLLSKNPLVYAGLVHLRVYRMEELGDVDELIKFLDISGVRLIDDTYKEPLDGKLRPYVDKSE